MIKIKSIHIYLISILLSMTYLIWTYPSAPGDVYEVHHTANLFLTAFGYTSPISTLPDAAPSLMAYYILREIILLVPSNNDPTLYYQLFFIVEFISRIASYILLFSLINMQTKYVILFAVIFSTFITFPGVPILLMVMPLYAIYKMWERSYDKLHLSFSIILIISFSTISLYWHTISITAFTVIISLILILIFREKSNQVARFKHWMNTLLIITSILASTWIYLRATTTLELVKKNIYSMGNSIEWDITKINLFSSGSFVPLEYQYLYTSIFPLAILNTLRYVVYFVIYLFVILVFIRWVITRRNGEEIKPQYLILSSLIISDMATKILHYVMTGVIGWDIFLPLLLPMAVVILIFSLSQYRRKSMKIMIKCIVVIILSIIILTSLYNMESTHNQLPSRQTNMTEYQNSFYWITNHTEEQYLLSDSATSGYYQIEYVRYNDYCNVTIINICMSEDTYISLSEGRYIGNDSTIIVRNNLLFEKDLVFGSLEYWNSYEPLSNDISFPIRSPSIIYTDSRITLHK